MSWRTTYKTSWARNRCLKKNLLFIIPLGVFLVCFKDFGFPRFAKQQLIVDQPGETFKLQNDNAGLKAMEMKKSSQIIATEEVNSQADVTCQFPYVDPFDPAVLAIAQVYPPISCQGGVPHLVYLSGDVIRVNHSRTSLVGDTNNKFKDCRYKTLIKKPGSDFETVVTFISDPFNDSISLRDEDDADVVVECQSNVNSTVFSRSYFSIVRPRKDLESLLEDNLKKHIEINSPKEVLNVLMVGIDGNSKQNFQRHMPKTRNFLLNELQAIELHKYNKIDDHTFVNLVPMLTGLTWGEHWRLNQRDYFAHFDAMNQDFIWSKYRDAGYRTGVFFDDVNVTAFHFFKKGWDKAPVDYYMRATVVELEKDKLMKSKRFECVGDVPEISHNLNYWLQLATVFNNSKIKPYFGFSFSTHLTHEDHNYASAGDELYFQFLKELRDKNLIHNTVVFFFSDHGERFGKLRRTYIGMIESRTPYVFVSFPEWFHQKYPKLMQVLRINQERLTSNKDIYETLMHILNFQPTTSLGDINKPGISLFQEIPKERACHHAGISLQFCLCNQLKHINISSVLALNLATALQDKLFRNIYYVRDICSTLQMETIDNIMAVQSNNSQNLSLYQVTMTTRPGGGQYEATLSLSKTTQQIQVVGEIIRLNLYRGQADCIHVTKLKPFCYCVNST